MVQRWYKAEEYGLLSWNDTEMKQH